MCRLNSIYRYRLYTNCILRSTSWGPMKNWKMMASKRKFSEQPKKLPVFGEDFCSSWSGEFPVLMSKDALGNLSLFPLIWPSHWRSDPTSSFAKRRKRPYSILGVAVLWNMILITEPFPQHSWNMIFYTMCVEKLQMMRTYNKIVQVQLLFPKSLRKWKITLF